MTSFITFYLWDSNNGKLSDIDLGGGEVLVL